MPLQVTVCPLEAGSGAHAAFAGAVARLEAVRSADKATARAMRPRSRSGPCDDGGRRSNTQPRCPALALAPAEPKVACCSLEEPPVRPQFIQLAVKIRISAISVASPPRDVGRDQRISRRRWRTQPVRESNAGPKSGVGRTLGDNSEFQPAHPFTMRRVEAAGDDEDRADHGPDVGQFAEDEKAENADPQQLGVLERRQYRGIGIAA